MSNQSTYYLGRITGLPDKREVVGVVYLDFSKDCGIVSYGILISKLETYGLLEKMHLQLGYLMVHCQTRRACINTSVISKM